LDAHDELGGGEEEGAFKISSSHSNGNSTMLDFSTGFFSSPRAVGIHNVAGVEAQHACVSMTSLTGVSFSYRCHRNLCHNTEGRGGGGDRRMKFDGGRDSSSGMLEQHLFADSQPGTMLFSP
jgi:hypothetical protein